MKKIIFLFIVVVLSTKAYSDTLNFWHVYINDSLIGKFNTASKNITIEIDKNKIKKKDVFYIKHYTDNPCPSCNHILVVKNKNKKLFSVKIKTLQPEEIYRISMSKIIKGEELLFYHIRENKERVSNKEKLILVLKIN